MGCNTSKLDDEEAVQICKDRKKFIKQALEHRTKFASGHIAYIQSLKRVSTALREYIEGDEPREFLLTSLTTPPFTPPAKRVTPKFINNSPKCFSAPPKMLKKNVEERSSVKINYYRPSGTASVSFEERPPYSPETFRVQSYSPIHQNGYDGFFSMQSLPGNSSSYYYSSQSNIPPPSPQNNNQWDFFWNPFSSLDNYYGYPVRSSLEQSIVDDDPVGLRQVREQEGIPDLEEESEREEVNVGAHRKEERRQAELQNAREEINVEDDVHELNDEEDEDEDDEETECECENHHESNKSKPQENEVSSQVPNAGKVELNRHESVVSEQLKREEETPGFTVYVNRRPTSMNEVIKDLEAQFVIICDSASEVSVMLEANRAQCSSTSIEITAAKMLNPVALFRSASSRSSSSRFLVSSSGGSGSRDGTESSSEYSDESSMFSGSHHSTLDRLYAWEKRLYDEVRSGEKIRLAYEKKSTQLRNQDMKGEDHSNVEKTRIALRDLDTQIKVSIHSIEAIAKRIETLRDQELQPQLLELVQGLARMWNAMAKCHQMQKHTLDEAKLLLAGTPSKSKRHSGVSLTDPHRLARSAANLESELRNWRSCFESWILSQRSYVNGISSWLLRCMRCEPETSKLPFSPRRSPGVHPIFGICIQWTRLLDAVKEAQVLDGLDFFSAGMGSIYAQQQAQAQAQAQNQIGGSRRFEGGSMDMVETSKVEEEDGMTPEKMAEVAVRVLCAGMSVAMSSLTEFAVNSAEGYEELINQWVITSSNAERIE